MELQNAGNTGNTGNSQGTTRSQKEEGDKWEERRPQVTSIDRGTQFQRNDDDETRMAKSQVGCFDHLDIGWWTLLTTTNLARSVRRTKDGKP